MSKDVLLHDEGTTDVPVRSETLAERLGKQPSSAHLMTGSYTINFNAFPSKSLGNLNECLPKLNEQLDSLAPFACSSLSEAMLLIQKEGKKLHDAAKLFLSEISLSGSLSDLQSVECLAKLLAKGLVSDWSWPRLIRNLNHQYESDAMKEGPKRCLVLAIEHMGELTENSLACLLSFVLSLEHQDRLLHLLLCRSFDKNILLNTLDLGSEMLLKLLKQLSLLMREYANGSKSVIRGRPSRDQTLSWIFLAVEAISKHTFEKHLRGRVDSLLQEMNGLTAQEAELSWSLMSISALLKNSSRMHMQTKSNEKERLVSTSVYSIESLVF